jgi:hypothetical protein
MIHAESSSLDELNEWLQANHDVKISVEFYNQLKDLEKLNQQLWYNKGYALGYNKAKSLYLDGE